MIRVAVGILQRDNRILVAERPVHKPYRGYWEFPGGKIEAHETGEQALQRELHEELGIQVVAATPWFQHQHDYPDKSVLLELFRVTEFSGEPHGKEAQCLQWASFEELMALKLLEGNLAILGRVREIL